MLGTALARQFSTSLFLTPVPMLACMVNIERSSVSPAMRSNDNDSQFMELALQQARLAPRVGEVPIGAVLVVDNLVIAAAHNYREISQDPTAHAEIIIIRRAAEQLKTWRLTDSTLYVTLEPCPMCAGAIMQARIARLVFGAWDPKAGACGSILDIPSERRFNHRVQVIGGLHEEESRRLLQEFFQSKRAILSEQRRPSPSVSEGKPGLF